VVEIIVRNSARCSSCGDEIVSRHRHDFATCSCGNLSVDGGTAYLRRAVREQDTVEETSLVVEADEEPRTHTLEHSGIELYNVHHSVLCAGRPCPLHNRSPHPLRAWAQVWHDGHMMRVDPETGRYVIDPDEPG